MSSLFDTPIQEVDLVFPSYLRLQQGLVQFVLHLKTVNTPIFSAHLMQLEQQYGYLLSHKPSLVRFSENQSQAIRLLKQLEQDFLPLGILGNIQLRLSDSSRYAEWKSWFFTWLGIETPPSEAMQIAELLHVLVKSYRAVCDIWQGRPERRIKPKQPRKQSTYLVLASLSLES